MFLEAEENMPPALALYQRFRVGMRVGYSRRKDGLRAMALTMQKVLE
jgi:hypothetical protein